MKHPVWFALVNVALLIIGFLMLQSLLSGPQHSIILGGH
jgi:hypothetical protein